MAKNLHTVFPFYTALLDQYRYREDSEKAPCLTVGSTNFLPFIIRTPHHASLATSEIELDLYDVATNTKQATYHWHGNAGFVMNITVGTTYDYVYYTGTAVTTPALPIGSFYLVVTHPDEVYYSETFQIVNSLTALVKLEFANNTTLSGISPYFYQALYLNTTLKTPEYIREDTGEKRNGILVKEKQVVIKSEALRVLLAPEYLVDALMLLPLMDNVYVTPQGGSQTTYSEVRMKDPEWIETANGSRAKVEIQLLTVLSIKKLNFKEMGYTETTQAIIKGDLGTTVSTGGLCLLQVTFAEEMPDANYIPAVPYCHAVALPNGTEEVWVGNIEKTGFAIYTLVPCNVRWTAIHV
ncbi:MAG: hypothetical protein M0P47_09135 [Bacteroidales bacterium]|nr:hypothetical protein [Bacteroidales bacterium]